MLTSYRLLNKETKIDVYWIPRIDELLDQLSQAKVFSKMEFYQGYHQIPDWEDWEDWEAM